MKFKLTLLHKNLSRILSNYTGTISQKVWFSDLQLYLARAVPVIFFFFFMNKINKFSIDITHADWSDVGWAEEGILGPLKKYHNGPHLHRPCGPCTAAVIINGFGFIFTSLVYLFAYHRVFFVLCSTSYSNKLPLPGLIKPTSVKVMNLSS